MANRSWTTEWFARALRRLFVEADNHPVDWLRRALNKSGAYHPAMAKVTTEHATIADVDCLMVGPKNGADSKKVIVYFHGGGYMVGSPQGYKAMLAQLAVNARCLVIAPDYRLAPEHPFPIPQDDCLAVTQAVADQHSGCKLVLAGDSAGGGLAISTALALAERDQVDALVLLSPWVEPTADGGSMLSNQNNDFLIVPFLERGYSALMQSSDPNHPRTNFASVDLSSLPTTLIQCGEGELFFDQIQSFAGRAETAGVDLTLQNYPGQFHVFQLLSAILKDGKHAMLEIAEFINRR